MLFGYAPFCNLKKILMTNLSIYLGKNVNSRIAVAAGYEGILDAEPNTGKI